MLVQESHKSKSKEQRGKETRTGSKHCEAPTIVRVRIGIDLLYGLVI